MKNIKCITIYPEVYHNQNLTPNDKIYLSVIRYYTLEGRTHCCKFSDKEMSEELLIGINQIRKIKCNLKKLGLINVTEKGIKYVSQNCNETLPNSNETLPNSNETLPNSNETLPNSNETLPNSNQNPCNSNENQQVAEVNKENKDNKEKNKEENKEGNKDNKDQNESLDDYLTSWVENALREKEENYKREKEEKDKNYCSVVDMVESLPVKEDTPTTPTEKPSLNRTPTPTPIPTSISIVERMINTIDYWIQTEIVNNNSLNQSTKERLLKDNTYNKIQLTKYLSDYIENKDLNKLNTNKQFFENITKNAFKAYKLSINNQIRKASLSKKNPYSDLEDDNGYKETNRWMNK